MTVSCCPRVQAHLAPKEPVFCDWEEYVAMSGTSPPGPRRVRIENERVTAPRAVFTPSPDSPEGKSNPTTWPGGAGGALLVKNACGLLQLSGGIDPIGRTR